MEKPSIDTGYREPFKGFYVKLACNKQFIHEDKVKAIALSINKELRQTKLRYICPVCSMEHVMLLGEPL